MEYTGTKQVSEKWGYSQGTVSNWCRNGLIKDVEQDKKGNPWKIPINPKCPKPIEKNI